MTKHILILFVFIFTSFYGSAQTALDALRYSRIGVGGTARSLGVGGAFSTLGADLTAANVNPAALGVYRHSEMVLSPTLSFDKAEGNYAGTVRSNNKRKFTLNNAGVVFAKRFTQKGWKSKAFSIGYNRLADFNRNYVFQGTSQGNIGERFVQLANGFVPEQLYPFEDQLAYNTAVIDLVSGQSDQYYSLLDPSIPVQKQQSIRTTGSLDELSFGYGGNYNHKLYIGGMIGIPIIAYTEEKSYSELDIDGASSTFNNMSFTETLTASGLGINFKLGLIYKIMPKIRVGASIQSPSFSSITETYTTSMNANTSIGNYDESGPEGNFEYRLSMPWRTTAGVSYIIKKLGFVSLEAEYVNYKKAKFNFGDDASPEDEAYAATLNESVRNTLNHGLNVRVGTEIKVKMFQLRGGYALLGSPYSTVNTDKEGALVQQNVSAGIGFRQQQYFIDFAYVRSFSTDTYTPYQVDSPTEISVDNTYLKNRFVLSLGYRF